jgi:transposase-like protein
MLSVDHTFDAAELAHMQKHNVPVQLRYALSCPACKVSYVYQLNEKWWGTTNYSKGVWRLLGKALTVDLVKLNVDPYVRWANTVQLNRQKNNSTCPKCSSGNVLVQATSQGYDYQCNHCNYTWSLKTHKSLKYAGFGKLPEILDEDDKRELRKRSKLSRHHATFIPDYTRTERVADEDRTDWFNRIMRG